MLHRVTPGAAQRTSVPGTAEMVASCPCAVETGVWLKIGSSNTSATPFARLWNFAGSTSISRVYESPATASSPEQVVTALTPGGRCSSQLTAEKTGWKKRRTVHSYRWLNRQVKNADGTLNLDKLYEVARRWHIEERYEHLNAGQIRMNIG